MVDKRLGSQWACERSTDEGGTGKPESKCSVAQSKGICNKQVQNQIKGIVSDPV